MAITSELIRLFRERFVQRTDLYPIQLEGGGYTVVRRPLTDAVIRRHLEGRLTLGLYATPESTTRWLCIDLDTRDKKAVQQLWQGLDRCGVPHLTEFSGRKGYHLWVFFPSPVSNCVARALGRTLTWEHEVFPKQDRIPQGGLGSLVKAPLGLHRVTGVRCLFLDRDLNALCDQMQTLREVSSIDPAQVLKRCSPKAWLRLAARPQMGSSAAPVSGGPRASLPLIKDCVRRVLLEGTRKGHRNQVGYIIATELRRVGVPLRLARAMLVAVWNPRNDPPLGEREIETILESAYRGPKRTYGCRPDGEMRMALECLGPQECLYATAHSLTRIHRQRTTEV